jgi:hypothetical protein
MTTETKASLVLVVFGLWILIHAFALYGYGTEGLWSGLDPANYRGHPIDLAMHWLFLFGPPVLAVVFGLTQLLKRR